MKNHGPQPKFDELQVGNKLQNGEKLLQIVAIDYRRNMVYYEELGAESKKQGVLTERMYTKGCQNGNINTAAVAI